MGNLAPAPNTSKAERRLAKARERYTFFFVSIILFPLLSIVLIGGYGLIIWVSQMIFGPPSI